MSLVAAMAVMIPGVLAMGKRVRGKHLSPMLMCPLHDVQGQGDNLVQSSEHGGKQYNPMSFGTFGLAGALGMTSPHPAPAQPPPPPPPHTHCDAIASAL